MPTEPQKQKRSYRSDGFVNSVIGHSNKQKDPMANFSFIANPRMSDSLLLAMFKKAALAKRIVSLPADESTKHWIEIKADKEKLIENMLDVLGAEEIFADAVRWSRLYGGSVILMLVNDGQGLEDELDEKNIQYVEQLRVYDKTQVFFWDNLLLYDDPASSKYGEPMYYQINPIGGNPFYVHESRLLKFAGDPIPDIERVANQGWGDTALGALWDEILNNTHCHKLAILIMERMGQVVLQLDGLLEVLEEENGDAQVKARLDTIDMARSILNTIAIDAKDDFKIHNLSVSGISDLIDRFGFALSAACNIPFVILFGHNPKGSGLSQSGGTDLESWYNFVGQIQKRHIKKPLYRLIKLLMLSKNGPFKGKELDKWCIDFKPLWSPSELEQAQANDADASSNFKNAQANTLMITNKVLSSAEVQRKLGYTPEEIVIIDGEVSKESESKLADTIGHSFNDVPNTNPVDVVVK